MEKLDYEDYCQVINDMNAIFAKYDIEQLIVMGAPDDEYNPESKDIIRKLVKYKVNIETLTYEKLYKYTLKTFEYMCGIPKDRLTLDPEMMNQLYYIIRNSPELFNNDL